jgi:hypothetical protein
MQVVKVTLTPTGSVFSQELATRCGDVLTLDTDYMLDHSSDGYDIFQNYIMKDYGVIINERVMGDTVVVCRSSFKACCTQDVVDNWGRWTKTMGLSPIRIHPEAGIHVNNGSITKKSRKTKCEEDEKEHVPEEREVEESCDEDEEYDDDEVVEDDDGDHKGVDVDVE